MPVLSWIMNLDFAGGTASVHTFDGSIGVCVQGRQPAAEVTGVTPQATVTARVPRAVFTGESMGCPNA